MKKVTEKEFYDFINEKDYKIVQGEFFHEDWFVDEDNKVVASRITSSYGAETEYRIL